MKDIDLRCCGNCMNLLNRYYATNINVSKAFKDDFEECYPRENFQPASNLLLCRKRHYPKFTDKVCDDWEYDKQTLRNRRID